MSSGVSQTTCPRPAACSCDSYHYHHVLTCGGKTSPLSHVPTFSTNSYANTLNMTDNHITSLPGNAFSHLTRMTAIYLNRNRILSVHSAAFSGLQRFLYTLDLSYNQLQTVPESLKTLEHLRDLRLQYNPIKLFQPSVEWFAILGTSLQAFNFGSPDLQTLPAHLSLLRHLKTLTIHGLKMSSLPRDMQHVTSLYLDSNSLTTFPSVYNMFPNLSELSIINNPGLTTIPSHAIPTGKHTRFVTLNGNGLTTVPLALEKLPYLTDLALNNNKITSISRALNFPHLAHLSLSGNPIHSFSSKAFTKIPFLTKLYLANTGQTTIPQALSAMHGNLWTIDLQHNPIHCTCALKWAKHWLETYVNTGMPYDSHNHKLLGTCQGSKTTLDSYVKQNTAHCH